MSTQPLPSTPSPRFWDDLTNTELDLFVAYHAMKYSDDFPLLLDGSDRGNPLFEPSALPVTTSISLAWKLFQLLSDIRGTTYAIARVPSGKWEFTP